MKKFLSKTRLGLLVLLGIFAFGLTNASAQLNDPTGTFTDSQKSSWLAPNAAVAALEQQIVILDGQLQGTPDPALKYKLKFFNTVKTSIEEGAPVPAAIDDNFIRFVSLGLDKPVEFPNNLGTAVWNGYYVDIVNMVKN